jgi:hypothetical protein
MSTVTKILGDYQSDCTAGDVQGVEVIHKFGRNNSAGTTVQDVRAEGGVFIWPTSAYPLVAYSGLAGDTAVGSGARVVTVEGLLGGTFERVLVDITMNGTSASTATTSEFIRVNRAWVKETGSYNTTSLGANLGRITVRHTVSSQTMTVIASDSPNPGQSQQTNYTVPASKFAMVKAVTANVDSAKTASISFWKREGAHQVVAPFTAMRNQFELNGVSGVNPFPIRFPLGPFPEKTDLWFTVIAGAAGTEVEVDYEIELRDKKRE